MRVVTILLLTAVAVFTPSVAHADRLVVAAAGVNANIVQESRGGVENPPMRLWDTFRWRDGVQPCEGGSMVIVGHTYEGGAAVFNHLSAASPGSTVKIIRKGRDCEYRVTKNFLIPASRGIGLCYGWNGGARGCLITCVNKIGPGVYTHRRIVQFVLKN